MIPTQQMGGLSIADLPARAIQMSQEKLAISGGGFCRNGAVKAIRIIKNNADAPLVCPVTCYRQFSNFSLRPSFDEVNGAWTGTWTGSWTQTASGSICGCVRRSPC